MCYHRYMGLFDDLIGVAKEFNDLKHELTTTVTQATDDVVRIKTTTTAAVTQLKSEASSAVSHVKNRTIDIKNTAISDFTAGNNSRQSR